MLEDASVCQAKIAKPRFPIRGSPKTVLGAVPVTGETDLALCAVLGQLIQLITPEPLLPTRFTCQIIIVMQPIRSSGKVIVKWPHNAQAMRVVGIHSTDIMRLSLVTSGHSPKR